MLRLFVKDNTSGTVHEYGTSPHDSLVLQDDGSLHYENLQNCTGTKFPVEGYSFCLEDGTIPKWDMEHGVEPYIDIGGADKKTVVQEKAQQCPYEEAVFCKPSEMHCETCGWNKKEAERRLKEIKRQRGKHIAKVR